MVRSCLVFIAALSLTSSFAAELPQSSELDDVIVWATPDEQPDGRDGYDNGRAMAIRQLRGWPKTTAEDEARIAAALLKCLHSSNGNARNDGAFALGDRNHSEVIPLIFELGEKDPGLISIFFACYTGYRKVEPPIDLFRKGLGSKNPVTKQAILSAIRSCKAVALRTEIEALLESDSSDDVRDDAASTLMQLGLRESAPAFRRAWASGYQQASVIYGLTRLGNEADIAKLLPLLKSKDESLRRTVTASFSTVKLRNPKPVCDAVLGDLRDPSKTVRFQAIQTLSHFRDSRAIPQIRELVTHPAHDFSWDDRGPYVEAISAIGGREAVRLLDDMVQMDFRSYFGLEDALTRFGSPSSGRAIWKAYLKDPIRVNPAGGDVPSIGYYDARDVLAACADAELLQYIRQRFATASDYYEKDALAKVIGRIQARLNK